MVVVSRVEVCKYPFAFARKEARANEMRKVVERDLA
jgi:hypothetical protein